MTSIKVQKPSVRKREAIEGALLDAAERLFSERAVEAVSMREIAVAAGTTNHFAVQHYFKNKDELIRAIFRRRAVSIEGQRSARLAALSEAGKPLDTRNLLEVMFLPVIEELDRQGNRSYARFLLRIMWANPYMQIREEMNEHFPMSNYVSTLLCRSLPGISTELFAARLSASASLFLHATLNWEHGGGGWRSSYADFNEAVADALEMAAAALEAQVSFAGNRAAPGSPTHP
ncbi:MAG: TetR/AcrR family transcriptional regulator [Sphingobium sp.]